MIAVREQLGALLAADATTLAPGVNANKIALIGAPFTPRETLHATDLTLLSGNGLSPIQGVTGAQVVGLDPVTQQQVIVIKAPAGGYQWVTSGGLAVTKSIYGYALLDSTLATLLAVQALATPITVSADGYLIDFDPVEMTIVLAPIS
jgi:hypothetical protein